MDGRPNNVAELPAVRLALGQIVPPKACVVGLITSIMMFGNFRVFRVINLRPRRLYQQEGERHVISRPWPFGGSPIDEFKHIILLGF
jgi:hypothetical protein